MIAFLFLIYQFFTDSYKTNQYMTYSLVSFRGTGSSSGFTPTTPTPAKQY